MFSPPLYVQRHQFVIDFVKKHTPKKVADLGCGECRLLSKLRFHRVVPLLVGLDVNGAVVKERMHTLAPFPIEYVLPGQQSLTIELYQGSVLQKEPRFRGYDLVSCVELIEHLQPADVERFSEVLFGYMAPKTVIITTPNADFNPLLPGLRGFRDKDHKFEWTQVEFQNWALEVCRCYGYMVDFTGVGKAHCDQETVGFCTQIGIFHKDISQNVTNLGDDNTEHPPVYKLLYKVVYPSLQDNNIFHKTLVNEVLYCMETIKRQWLDSCQTREMTHQMDDSSEDLQTYRQGNGLSIPLVRVLSSPRVQRLCNSQQRLREILQDEPQVRLHGDALWMEVREEEPDDLEVSGSSEDEGCVELMQQPVDCEDSWD